MRIPILSERTSRVIHRAAVVLVVALPLVVFPYAADPYQPARAFVLGVAGAAAVALGALRPGQTRAHRVAFGALATTVAFVALSAALAEGPASTVFGVHGRFQGLVSGLAALLALGVGLTARGAARTLARAAGVVVFVVSAAVLWQTLQGAVPTATMGNQVLAAGWLVTGTAVAAAGARVERGATAAALWAVSALGVVALGALGSRGAWVGAVAAGIVLALTASRRVRAVMAAGLLVALLTGVSAGGAEALGKLDPSALTRGSAAARAEIWQGAASMVATGPALGVGPGRFLYEYPVHQTVAHARIEPDVRPDQAHSVLLHTAAESGVPAALAALVFAASVARIAARGVRGGGAATLVAAVGLAAWGGQSLFGISTIETDGLAFLLAGIALSQPTPVARTRPTTRAAHQGPARGPATLRVAVVVSGVGVALLSGWYLVGDVSHARGQDAFYSGAMREAWEREVWAVTAGPWVDVYRVGASDAVLYGAAEPAAALALVDAGLALEPASHDLAAARARLLSAGGVDMAVTLDAYRHAAALYPFGIAANHDAIAYALENGYEGEARELARGLLAVFPNDAYARSVAEGGHGAP